MITAKTACPELHIPKTFSAALINARLTRQLYAQDLPQACEAGVLASRLRRSLEVLVTGQRSISTAEGRMTRIIQFICCNLAREGLRPLHAAKEFKCSSRTIHRTCADNGTTFRNVLTEIRLSVAAYRLSIEEECISEVAYSSGFASLAHFSRLFKARFGLAPSDYRRRSARQT
ncbi:AraC family transcriptional regulator [Bradyrhizobium sp. B124]|uniref:helix-turn-helix transcriptional regulator n=1 Tax=Bradyrhizobium sp. B124 TaxID=3140245 RepID=UPI0031840D8D